MSSSVLCTTASQALCYGMLGCKMAGKPLQFDAVAQRPGQQGWGSWRSSMSPGIECCCQHSWRHVLRRGPVRVVKLHAVCEVQDGSCSIPVVLEPGAFTATDRTQGGIH